MDKLCINSSEIANLSGYNKYTNKNIEKIIDLFINNLYKNREDLKEYDEDKGVIKFINEQQATNELLEILSENENKEIKKIINTDLKDTDSLQQNSNKIKKIINNSNITNEQKQKISNNINGKINCNYGNNTEKKAIEIYERKTLHKIYDNNILCYTKHYDNFLICGKTDGFIDIDNKTYINEIKNRKNRLFDFIPIYEKIQLLSYTKLCDNTNIVFTQNYRDTQKTEYFKDYIDEKLWNDVLNKLDIYSNTIYKFREDNGYRQLFLKKDNQSRFECLKVYLNWL